ncbi:MAG: hypothetical protein GX442_01385 [Candidatus Riflebacteria bacterium]|nr:hypothetical protein [Candidatus Riflebacteria bacterium]
MVLEFRGFGKAHVAGLVLLLAMSIAPGALPAASAQVTGDASQVTLDVRDADLRQVFQLLANKAGINVLVSPKVKGSLTCRVVDMDPRELILFIARTNGLVIEDHGRILLILTDIPAGSRTRMEVIPLQNAKAADVAKMIETIKIDKRARVTHDERTNRLIVVYEE